MTLVTVRPGWFEADRAEALASLFERETEWESRDRDNTAYGITHGQSFSHPAMPQNGERYVNLFDGSPRLENHPLVTAAAAEVGATYHRCYRLRIGGCLRIHVDDFFGGALSYTYYPNRVWRWDWGGLLHVLSEDVSTCEAVLPGFNVMAVASNRLPHFVDQVAPWANAPRFVLAMFGAPQR